MDILLHNLSHADLLLGVVTPAEADSDVLIVRPKFSKFHTISKSLYDHIIQNLAAIKIVNSPLHNRRESSGASDGESVPIGFDLRDVPATCDIRDVRFRKELPSSEEDAADACSVHFIYFPLLAVLLKRWQQHMRHEELHLILVSGRGQPIDQSSQELDNSTQFTGHLVDEFVKRTLERSSTAQLTVHLIHSDTNLFRYDENILFVKRELLPQIHELRRQVVARRKDKWRDFMRMTLSFADGSSARISAINQSLKIYQPAYMHFWSLKSFWREQRIYEDDVEFHMFEEIATEPAMRLKDLTDPQVLKAVAEVDSFHREFEAVAARDDNDLRAFWLRKTMKAVLAVLIVQDPATGELLAYRGTNLEVSLPTGSLCAERNAIGTAFAANMALKREDIKLVAVYSAAIEDKPKRRKDSDAADAAAAVATAAACLEAPVPPTSAAAAAAGDTALLTPRVSALQRQASTSARTRAILGINDGGLSAAGASGSALSPSHQRASGTPATTVTSPTSPAAAKRPLSQLMPSPPAALSAAASTGPVAEPAAGAQPLRKRRKTIPFSSPEAVPASHHHSVASAGSSTNLTALSDGAAAASAAAVAEASPLCVASSVDALLLGAGTSDGGWACEGRAHTSNLATMETIETGENDLNPLKPCGTCTSWLQKIVKCNPDFRVVTFTDARRQGIYVEYIQE